MTITSSEKEKKTKQNHQTKETRQTKERRTERYSWEFFLGMPPSCPNPDPISDLKMYFNGPVLSDL